MSSGKSKSGVIGSRRPSAARERSRVQNLREAFQSLQSALPAVPPSTKLSKLDVLLMASAYIAQLGRLLEEESPASFLDQQSQQTVIFHPVKKWPMRARLYAGLTTNSNMQTNQQPPPN